jgi:hypothetical protein
MKCGVVVNEEHWTASYKDTQRPNRHIVISAQCGENTVMEFFVYLHFNFDCNQEMWRKNSKHKLSVYGNTPRKAVETLQANGLSALKRIREE